MYLLVSDAQMYDDLRPTILFNYSLKLNYTRHLETRQCLEKDNLFVSIRRIYRLIPGDGLGWVMMKGGEDLAGGFPTSDVGCEADMS